MQEYVTRAVVLDKQSRGGDADARYYFFTERFGKIAARAKSSRKIVSKLAGHLEPGTLAAVRIIEQHGAQVVDALKISRLGSGMSLADLSSLNNLLPEWEPEPELWKTVSGTVSGGDGNTGKTETETVPDTVFSWIRTLAILGWDPRGAACSICGRPAKSAAAPSPYFGLRRQEFFCASCASKFRRDEILLINGSEKLA